MQKQIEICPTCFGSGEDCDRCDGLGTIDVEITRSDFRTRSRNKDRMGDRD